MANDFFYGKSARFMLAAVPYDGRGWTVDASADEMRTDNTSTNGFTDRIAALKDAPFTMEKQWDASANPLDDPPGLFPGKQLTTLKLHLDHVAAGPFWLMPKAIILTVPMQCVIDNVCMITITGANKGGFSFPTGNFAPSAPAAS